jgi:ferredoxin
VSPRVLADRDRCVGAGNCVLTLPAVFDQDDDEGLVVVLDPEPPAETTELLDRAVQLCPSGAISRPAEDVATGPARPARR